MALKDLQAVLARLYLDRDYREQFFVDQDRFLNDEALTDADRAQLRGLDRAQVERFARALRNKRLSAIREFLPATDHALRGEADRLFGEYAIAHPSTPEPLTDALQFSAFVQEAERIPLWPRELARLEQLRLEILHAPYQPDPTRAITHGTLLLTPLARVERFHFDMEQWYPTAMSQPTPPPPEDESWVLVGKKSGAFRVRLKRVNGVTARILRMCDGTRTPETILREAAAVLCLDDTQRQDFSREVMEMLTPLQNAGLIEVR